MSQMLGKHQLSTEDGVMYLVTHGTIASDEMAVIMTTLQDLHQEHGQSFLIADVSHGIGLSSMVRKQVAAFSKRTGYTSTFTFVVGAGSVTRALILIVTRTIELLGGPKSNLDFVDSVDLAKARIAQLKAIPVGGK